MQLQLVKDLAELMRQYGLGRLEVRDSEVHVLLESQKHASDPAAIVTPSVAVANTVVPAVNTEKPVPASAPETPKTDAYCQKSPLVGTLYLAPSEDSPRFVEVGTKVKKGDTLCIVEAMKVLNELTAETDGKIVEVCGKNAALVEFGQPLFLIEKV
ncbi:MAG TPA: acetyl-CoA carboxylase biotin carboxyl carrier protein [Oscillospiraceae bacterium]|nr:acetyl-CoA carboxylase biotin carboxyl carrier protein [Oscillospiraceae bacterium]HPS34387.1 acetyl-CoA carboxylase biotin carboxyl carrier protein [Oscillospiraceae bacterium]